MSGANLRMAMGGRQDVVSGGGWRGMARTGYRARGVFGAAAARRCVAVALAASLALVPAIAGAYVVTAVGDTATNYSLVCGNQSNPMGTTAVLNEGAAACGTESRIIVDAATGTVATFYGKNYSAQTRVRGRELELFAMASTAGDLTFKFGYTANSGLPATFNELASGTGPVVRHFEQSNGYVRYLLDLRGIDGTIPAGYRFVFRIHADASTFRGGVMIRSTPELPSMKLSYYDRVVSVASSAILASAVATVSTGTTIVLLDGVYTGVQLNFSGKQLAIISENGPANCIIDGQYAYGTFLTLPAGATNQTVIEGLTIKRYYASALVSNASYPIVRGCVFQDNDATTRGGGAIRLVAQSAMGGTMLVENCTFANNHTSGSLATDNDGGAIAIYPSSVFTPLLTVKRSTFLRNTSTEDGGAIFVGATSSDVQIYDSVFVENAAQTGGAIHAATTGAVKADRCRFERNYAEAAGAVYSAQVALLNSVFVHNAAAGVGGAVTAVGGTPTAHTVLDFCTLTGNFSLAGGGVVVNALSSGASAYATVVNSILWGDWHTSNALGSELYLGTRGTNAIRTGRCDIQGGTAGALLNNGTLTVIDGRYIMDEDPFFAFADSPHLMPGSPCLDQGILSPSLPTGMGLTQPQYDADGVYRNISGATGGAPDFGAYEYHGEFAQPLPIVSPERLLLTQRQGGPPPDAITLSVRDASSLTLPWAVQTDVDWLVVRPPGTGELTEGTATAAVVVDSAGLAAGEYHGNILVRVNSADAPSWPVDSPRVVEVFLTVTRQSTVCASGCDFTTIQSAIDSSVTGDEVLVLDGTYAGGITTRSKALTLRSANGRDATTIDCGGAGRGITVPLGSLRETIIEGFTIQGCSGSGTPREGGGIWSGPLTKVVVLNSRLQNNVLGTHASGTKGGGMNVGWWAEIARSEFVGNDADWGGGVYVGPNLEGVVGIEETTFKQNVASNGGGLYISQSATGYSVLLGNTFDSNTTGGGRSAVAYGFGAYLTGSNIGVEACTFKNNGNGTGYGGGMFLNATSSLLMNNLLTGNQAAVGGGLYVFGGNAWVTNSTFYGNTATTAGAPGGGGVYLSSSASSGVTNCSATGNTCPGGAVDIYPVNDSLGRVTYSNIGSGWTSGYNNVLGSAGYVNAGGGDFRLLPTSNLIDKGTGINWLFSDLRGSARAVDGDSNGLAKIDLGAYEYSRFYGGIGEDQTAKAFRDLAINGSVVATGYEYRIQWQTKDPFPEEIDERVRQAGEYGVRLLLISEGGRRLPLGTWTMRLGSQYTVPFTFGADHVGTWRLRLEMVADINQYVDSEPFSIQYKELIPYTLGRKIPPPVGALPGLKPDVDNAAAVYWSTETNELYAIAPHPVQLTWFADKDRTIPLLVMGMIQTPADPVFHVADAPPVELRPAGTRFTSVGILWSDSSAIISSERFTAPQDGWTTLLFKDSVNPAPERREVFSVVRTLTWDHKGVTNVSGAPYNGTLGTHPPVDPVYPVEKSLTIGVKAEDGEHQPNAACSGGHVLNELAPYNGAGDDRAYDRPTRSGQIFAVNDDDPNTEDDDLVVIWYRRQGSVADGDPGVCWPFKPVRYDPAWPTPSVTCPGDPPGSCDRIEISSAKGSGQLPPDTFGAWDNMSIYNQPDRRLPGFNPNEEHALLFAAQGTPYPGAFPLRNDFNRFVAGDWSTVPVRFTSRPYVLVKHRDPVSGEWRFKVFFVTPGDLTYAPEAGNEFNPPYPLNQFVFGPCRDILPAKQPPWDPVDPAAPHTGTWTDAELYKADGTNMGTAEALLDKDKKLFSIRGDVTVRTYQFYRLQEGFWFDLDNNGWPDKPGGTCIPLLGYNPAWTSWHTDWDPAPIIYNVVWPETPTLYVGETLADAKTQAGETVGLPNVKDQCIVAKLWDEAGVRLFDPLKEWTTTVDLVGEIETLKTDPVTGTGTNVKFRDLPPQLQGRITYDDVNKLLKLKGEYITTTGEPVLMLNTLSVREIEGIKAALDLVLHPKPALLAALLALKAQGDPNLVGKPSIARWQADFKAVSAGNVDNTGFVTLAFNNHEDCPAPTMLSVFEVDCELYRGDLKVVESPNPFEEKLTLRHNGDFGGLPDARWFEWVYLQGYSGIPEGPGTEGENWLPFNPANSSPGPTDGSTKTMPPFVDGGPVGTAYHGLVDLTPKGTGQQLLPDRWFAVRYYYRDSLNYHPDPPDGGGGVCTMVSPWTPPQLAEGWVKRVMKKINLFDQRVKDFHTTDADTVASMIAQAGRAYEGDVALSDDPEYLKRLGLIELYQTLLNRALALSVDADPPDPSLRDAVLFAANRLASLHMLLGNEAYADSADPTVGFGTQDGQYGAMASSIFAFQNQMDTLLDEELALLEGRDDAGIRPFYNRIPWNFTIADGEVAYRQVYNIQDVADSTGAMTPDGEINEYDAKFLFPQGHGDAWGYYLNAIKKLYYLVTHDAVDAVWVPTVEAILVAQAPVEVDYRDERLFATAAAARARAGADIVNLTYRRFYDEDPQQQWQGYRDSNPTRAWGLKEWASRAGQGAYIDWAVGNALLPAVSTTIRKVETFPAPAQARYVLGADYARGSLEVFVDPDGISPPLASGYTVTQIYDQVQAVYRTQIDFSPVPVATEQIMFRVSLPAEGIKKVDRTTVVDLHEVAAQYDAIQAVLDQADAGLNPLGVAKDTVPFDIDPTLVAAGQTHFEQIYNRALQALQNAVTVFDYAGQSSQMLRRQQDSLDDFKRTIDNREADFTSRLVEVFGYPYPEDCGPGKLYPTGYCETGPDIYHYMYVDPSYLMGDANTDKNATTAPRELQFTVNFRDLAADAAGGLTEREVPVSFTVDEDRRFGIIKPAAWVGNRRAPGGLQLARADLLQLRGRFERAMIEYDTLIGQVEDQAALIKAQYNLNAEEILILQGAKNTQQSLNDSILNGRESAASMRAAAQDVILVANIAMEIIPKVIGMATDAMSALRGVALAVGQGLSLTLNQQADDAQIGELSSQQAKEIAGAEANISITAGRGEFNVLQQTLQLENLVRREAVLRQELYTLFEGLQQSAGRYLNALASGERILEERLRFRKQTAAQVQDYRYTDMTFRVFRNDALQKYKAQLDLAGRYAYLAAKAYDYETTLLDASSMTGRAFLSGIVKERSIGTVLGGQPLTGTGLADVLRRLSMNFQVLKPQLGFNNPQVETNRFSLRREFFRVRFDANSDETWRKALAGYLKSDLWDVPEFRRYCRPFAAAGVPQPGLVIPFRTTVSSGLNFFGWPLGGSDSYYSASNFATKVRSVGVWFSNYNATGLAQTPRVYLVPAGEDVLRSPTGSAGEIRSWHVLDQRLPAPQLINTREMASDPGWIPAVNTVLDEFGGARRHSDFKAYHDSGYLEPTEMTYDTRLIGRSVWNTKWMLIIPGKNLLYDADEGLEMFINGPEVYGGTGERTGNGISDIKLFFTTYAYSGN